MALFGLGLNPLADVAKIGHTIGSAFGNGDDLLYPGGIGSPSQTAQITGGTFPAPQQPQTIQQSAQPNSSSILGTNTGGAAPAINPNQFQIDQVNSALGRLPTQLQVAQGNIQGGYNTNLNELNSGEQQAKGQYGQSTDQNHQQYVTNKNSITDQASSGLHSLLRLLGMHGAGGSSDALYSAPQAVATQAAQQRSGAGQTFGQNQQGLDTNWNNYESGVGQSKQKLNDWLSQQLNSAQSQSDSTHANLLQTLAGLQSSTSLAQPYIDQSNSLLGQVDQLGALNPTFDGKAPAYTPQSVASYTVNPFAPIQQNGPTGSALDSTTSPFWSLLNKDKTKQAPAF